MLTGTLLATPCIQRRAAGAGTKVATTEGVALADETVLAEEETGATVDAAALETRDSMLEGAALATEEIGATALGTAAPAVTITVTVSRGGAGAVTVTAGGQAALSRGGTTAPVGRGATTLETGAPGRETTTEVGMAVTETLGTAPVSSGGTAMVEVTATLVAAPSSLPTPQLRRIWFAVTMVCLRLALACLSLSRTARSLESRRAKASRAPPRPVMMIWRSASGAAPPRPTASTILIAAA